MIYIQFNICKPFNLNYMHTFVFSNEALMLIILIIPWVTVIRLANNVVDGVAIEIAQELASFLDLVVEDIYFHEFT
jgi:hypothetical protein